MQGGCGIFIIEGSGVNHNRSLDLTKKLVDAANKLGDDCLEFQPFISKNIVSKNAVKAEYQKQQTPMDGTQHGMLKKLSFIVTTLWNHRNTVKLGLLNSCLLLSDLIVLIIR